jgi:hypothetical protein
VAQRRQLPQSESTVQQEVLVVAAHWLVELQILQAPHCEDLVQQAGLVLQVLLTHTMQGFVPQSVLTAQHPGVL